MAWAKINDEHLTSYADSIRYAKDGSEYRTTLERAREEMHYTPTQMETELQNIAEGYVSAVDELAQDNTYFSEISTAIVDKDGGSPPEKVDMAGRIEALQIALPPTVEKDVNFYDYDGTLLYSYTSEEAAALTELPTLPHHEGLICQEWNWSLENAVNYILKFGRLNIGATYTTDNGETRLIMLFPQYGSSIIQFSFTVYDGTVTINWGDESDLETFTTTQIYGQTFSASHTYVFNKNTQKETTIRFSYDGNDGYIFNYVVSSCLRNFLYKVFIGNHVKRLLDYWLIYCSLLKSISFPNTLQRINQIFSNNYNLGYITLPKNINNNKLGTACSLATISLPDTLVLSGGAFENCYSLSNICIPKTQNKIFFGMFSHCKNLFYIQIPETVTNIEQYAFNDCVALKILDLSIFSDPLTLPILESTNALKTNDSELNILVKNQEMLTAFTTATNWSTYADRFQIKEA